MSKIVSVENGDLVRMRLISGQVIEKSLADVGHEMRRRARIVDKDGNPIPLKRMSIRRVPNGTASEAEVFDPGNRYAVCFDPSVGPHHAVVYKA